MFWYSRLFILFALETHKKSEKKSQIWYHSSQNSKNGLDKIIGSLNLIFGSTPFGKKELRSIASCNHQWVSYTSLQRILDHSFLPTAPGVSDLKDAFSQLLFWDLSTGVLWDLDLDSLLATSELSSALSQTISVCFLKYALGHCPARRPMTSDGDPSFPTLRSKILW